MTDEREDRRQQPKPPKPQYLSAATAAKKLGILLSSAPESFQESQISRDDLNALQADPPAWLTELRREGPHPRQEVSRRLGVSNSALARHGIGDALTSNEIREILEAKPAWLAEERAKLPKAP